MKCSKNLANIRRGDHNPRLQHTIALLTATVNRFVRSLSTWYFLFLISAAAPLKCLILDT